MILLIGPGAVGTILAAYLAAAGRPVKVYIREKDVAKFAAVQQLRVDRVAGGPPLIAPKPELTTSLDLTGIRYVLLAVKYPDLEGVLASLPDPLPPGVTLVSTLNGIGPMRLIRERRPGQRAVVMTIMYNGQLLAPLHAQITTRATVIIGSDDAQLLSLFDGSGMRVSRAHGDDAAWGKLLINLANAICALTHTTFKDLLTQPDMRAIYTATLDEAVGLLERAGQSFQLPMPIPYRAYRRLLLLGGPLPWWFAKLRNRLQAGSYPSMVADVEAGKRTEVAQLNGEVVRLAGALGHAAPISARIVALVEGMQGKVPPPYLTPADLRARLGIR